MNVFYRITYRCELLKYSFSHQMKHVLSVFSILKLAFYHFTLTLGVSRQAIQVRPVLKVFTMSTKLLVMDYKTTFWHFYQTVLAPPLP